MAQKNIIRSKIRFSKTAMTRGIAATALLSLALTSCTIVKMKEGITEKTRSISTLEDDLKIEESKRAEFLKNVKKMQAELRDKQLTLDEMKARLEGLRQQNAIAATRTTEQKKRRQIIDDEFAKLMLYREQMADTETRNNLTIHEQQNELKDIREKIDQSMELITTL